jgi:hypothetical protein
LKKLKPETNINKKRSKNTKTIKKEWKQMKQGKGNTVKKIYKKEETK